MVDTPRLCDTLRASTTANSSPLNIKEVCNQVSLHTGWKRGNILVDMPRLCHTSHAT